MALPTAHLSTSRTIYNARATRYDDSTHPIHALNYIQWTRPQPGQHILDLACGTGLVALPAKSAVGPTGTVTAVDISDGMIDVGKQKAEEQGLEVQWIEWDIGDLETLKGDGKLRREGYDLITCAAALVLLEDPGRAAKQWAGLLKKGGRLITDVSTEKSDVYGLVFEEVGRELGIPVAYCRAWVHGQDSLERLMLDAGLEIERAWKAPGIAADTVYETEGSGKLFDQLVGKEMFTAFGKENVRDKARDLFVRKFKEKVGEEGILRDENAFYVAIGRKP